MIRHALAAVFDFLTGAAMALALVALGILAVSVFAGLVG